MMLALLFAAAVGAQSDPAVVLRPLHTIDVASSIAGYARDEQYEYLATGGGVYRAPRIAAGPLERLSGAGEIANAVAVHDGTLYVLKGHTDAVAPFPTLLRSRDRGATFQSDAQELIDCSLEQWTKRCDYLVPTGISFSDGRTFLEASGNLLVAEDGTTSWNVLIGTTNNGRPGAQVCPLVHERIGTRVLGGSECPLDVAWIGSGTLRDDLLDWSVPFSHRAAITPALGNRMVQFIRHVGNEVVYSGVEGALLKSTDGGRSFRYVIFHPLEGGDELGYVVPPVERRYPYVQQLIIPSRHSRRVIVAGFDKAGGSTSYLAYSDDGGESWRDQSHLLTGARVALVVEDRDGRILIGVNEGDGAASSTRLALFELELPAPPPVKRRRAVH